MKFTALFTLFFLFPTNSQAETRHFQGHLFEAYIVSDSHRGARPYGAWGESRPALNVREGEEYSIVVRNPLPVRVGVAVSVDGLNTIDGKESRPARAGKWLIDPYSTITIRGWQTGTSRLRKFVFTRPKYSYAAWREQQDGRNYTRNLGVVGIAYFWDSSELRRARRYSQPFLLEEGATGSTLRKRSQQEKSGLWQRPDDRAGTGMGRREHHPVRAVHFNFDSGMYSNSDALKIYYRFGDYNPRPEPFLSYRYRGNDRLRYAPEMP